MSAGAAEGFAGAPTELAAWGARACKPADGRRAPSDGSCALRGEIVVIPNVAPSRGPDPAGGVRSEPWVPGGSPERLRSRGLEPVGSHAVGASWPDEPARNSLARLGSTLRRRGHSARREDRAQGAKKARISANCHARAPAGGKVTLTCARRAAWRARQSFSAFGGRGRWVRSKAPSSRRMWIQSLRT